MKSRAGEVKLQRSLRSARLQRATRTHRPTTQPLEPPANQVTVMCHYCGYEPPIAKIPADGRCPKCRGCSWERFVIPRRIFPISG
ncbi:MAG: hypothetical protein BIFFINMI_01951 [Phycisphaerae bacterium]|nr:hypothetical protein [Phycisphaerae bacterium]